MSEQSNAMLSKLGAWIIAATLLGAVVGLVMGETARMFAPVGDLFMQLIKMVVIPMVFFSLVGGGASLGNSKSAGKIGIVTFLYYAVTTILSVAVGLLFGEIFRPGDGISLETFNAVASNEFADKGALPGFWETVIGFVPANPFQALVDGNILQIIVFALFVGFAISKFSGEKKQFLLNVFNYMTEVLISIMTAIMYIAPIGVFALMADAVGTFGYEVLVKITYLVAIYIGVLFVVNYGIIGGSVQLFSKNVGFGQFFKSMYKVQLFAFSTASSMASLPLNMATVENELKVSKETASFALPLGATINMNGNAAYYALAACFFAQMFGIELSVGQYVAIIVTSTLGAVGQAGVPGPTLLVVAVLMAANIPIAALPILFGVDRIFDMLRTAVNITGDAACATIVDGLKDEK